MRAFNRNTWEIWQEKTGRCQVSAHTHVAFGNKLQTMIPVFSSLSGQTKNLQTLKQASPCCPGAAQFSYLIYNQTHSRAIRVITWNQLILSPAWPCSKKPTADDGVSIYQWRKARELHLGTSCKSLLSQFALIYEHLNTAAVCTTAAALAILVGDCPTTGRRRIPPKRSGKHMTWMCLIRNSYSLYSLIPGFYWCSHHSHSCTSHAAQS